MPAIQSSGDIAVYVDAWVKNAAATPNLAAAQSTLEALMSAWPNDRGIYTQLRKLADFIARTRMEISNLQPGDVKAHFISKATDELDAIVEGTASATNRIMDAADVITRVAERFPTTEAREITNAVTSIYEACTFQDITGQRVTKIVGMLKTIEGRLDRMVAALAEDGAVIAEPIATDNTLADGDLQKTKDAALLNGPALPNQAHSQADIDAIFGSGTAEARS
jgi:chemotaxis protein CheZ